MTPAAFKTRFPEFRNAADSLVQSVLDEAVLRVAPETFGDLTDTAIAYLAADALAASPFGTTQRLEDDTKETIYKRQYNALLKAKAIRMTWT